MSIQRSAAEAHLAAHPLAPFPEPQAGHHFYLRLWHGYLTDDDRSESDDWGADGPEIGPLQFCHTTYAADLKMVFCTPEDAARFGFDDVYADLPIDDGLVLFAGVRFGDWSLFVTPEL
jgi:hypothetical protein